MYCVALSRVLDVYNFFASTNGNPLQGHHYDSSDSLYIHAKLFIFNPLYFAIVRQHGSGGVYIYITMTWILHHDRMFCHLREITDSRDKTHRFWLRFAILMLCWLYRFLLFKVKYNKAFYILHNGSVCFSH